MNTICKIALPAVLGLSGALAHGQDAPVASAAASAAAAKSPEEVIALATPVLDKAVQQLSEMRTLSSGASLSRFGHRQGTISLVNGTSTVDITVPGLVAFVGIYNYAVTSWPDALVKAMRVQISEPGAVLAQACTEIGGAMEHLTIQPRYTAESLRFYRDTLFNLSKEQVTGQFTCKVGDVPAFVVVHQFDPEQKSTLLPPGHETRSATLIYAPRAVITNGMAAAQQAQEFDKRVQALRTSGVAGTPVQVNRTALLNVQLPPRAGTWICGLLVDRKELLMQVQVGANALFVPADQVVPQVTAQTARPGWPSVCTQAGVR
jgi:hypothetical protein